MNLPIPFVVFLTVSLCFNVFQAFIFFVVCYGMKGENHERKERDTEG